MKRSILAVFVSIILILSGCSLNKNSGKKTNSESGLIPAEGGTLNLSSYSPDTLNPLSTQYSCVRDFLYLVYEGLFVVNEDLSARGVLAENYSVSENNTVYTVNLKSGIKFHDGSDFDANDVTATFEYIQNTNSFYLSNLENVRSYTAKDNKTVVITLKSPQSDFVNNLDFPIMPSGLQRASFDVPNNGFKPVGTGRYKYDKLNEYVSLELLKNDSWHGETKVYIPNVCVRFVKDNDSMLYAFDSGETDLITTDRGRWGEFSYTANFTTSEVTTTRYTFLGVNVKNSYLSDAENRKKLAKAIDKKLLTDSLLFSHGTVADTPITSKAYFCGNADNSQKNDEKKPELQSTTLYLLYNEESAQKQKIAEYLKRVLEEYGIKIVSTKVDFDSYQSRIQSEDYQLYIGEIDMSRDASVRFMFNVAPQQTPAATEGEDGETAEQLQNEPAENTAPGGAVCNYTNPELDNLIYSMNVAANKEDAVIAYSNFKKFFDDNMPQIPLYHINDALLIGARIKGKVNKNLTNFYADLGEIYINYTKQ